MEAPEWGYRARRGRAEQEISPRVRLETRDSAAAYYFETRSVNPSAPAATRIQRNYLAKCDEAVRSAGQKSGDRADAQVAAGFGRAISRWC
jgi:hypothetical protein